jgi:FolB domain-containing protein
MTLELNHLDVECIIGDLPEERFQEQHLDVCVELEICDLAAESDSLSDTVDYASLSFRIGEALREAKCRMIERAAKVVYDVCTVQEYVISARVKITKSGCVSGLESASAVYPSISREGGV